MKKILCTLLLMAVSLQVQAGFWESVTAFFGGTEANSNTATQPEQAQTGLQLLPLLTQQLGVSNRQAAGGMGALLQAARVLLSQTEYAALAQAIPNATTLERAAPRATAESTGETGLFNSALAIAAEYSDTARAGRQLIAQFQSLGLGVDMIPLFTNVVGDYLKQTGNAEAGNLLITVLAAIL